MRRRESCRVIVASLLSALLCSPAFAEPSGSTPAETKATVAAPQPAATQPAEPQNTAKDVAAIRAESRAFEVAFNQHDAKAIAALWTETGEYIAEDGQTFIGRANIEKQYAEFFAQSTDSKLQIFVDSVRILSDSAALEEGHTVLEPAPAGAPGISKYTAVHVKVSGKWLMASVRDTWSNESSHYHHVADLEWLIGTWTAEEHGTTMKSICRWVANKRFVERRYTSTHADGSESSGLQIIGWNPQAGHVQSWNFSSDGGHSIGTWNATASGWSAQTQGTTGEGHSVRSVNLLNRLDDNAYVWQSVARSVDEKSLPDTHEVVLKRQSK